MLKGSNLWKVSFYINGEFYDSVEMKNEILNLSTNEIYIGRNR